jgi:phosphohistidine phosphatase
MSTLYLVRHAAAEERSAGQTDEDRALTDEGVRKFRQAARGIVRILGENPPELILTSPLLRARQTAELLAEAFDDAKIRIELRGLNALGTTPSLSKLLKELHNRDAIAVGHEPTLSEWIGDLCFETTGEIEMKKGAIAAVELAGSGKAKLLFIIQPAVLREL